MCSDWSTRKPLVFLKFSFKRLTFNSLDDSPGGTGKELFQEALGRTFPSFGRKTRCEFRDLRILGNSSAIAPD